MTPKRLFTEHPAQVGETYTEHLLQAGRFSVRMFIGSIACLIHAFLPFVFKDTGSNAIKNLYERMVAKRRLQNAPPSTLTESA